MDKLGLGILDKYTVIIVLLTLILAQAVFGLTIPIDMTASPTQLLINLALFTGYIYLAHSVLRLPVAIIAAIIYTKKVIWEKLSVILHYQRLLIQHWSIGVFFGYIFSLFLVPIILIFAVLMTVLNFIYIENLPEFKKYNGFWFRAILRFLDRFGIVIVAWVSTIPSAITHIYNIGAIGIGLMILMFVFQGDFAALIDDSLAKSPISEKPDSKSESSGDKNLSISGSLQKQINKYRLAAQIRGITPINLPQDRDVSVNSGVSINYDVREAPDINDDVF